MTGWLNISTRKVGGIRFVKIGRLNLGISVAREYRAFPPSLPPPQIVVVPVQIFMIGPTSEGE